MYFLTTLVAGDFDLQSVEGLWEYFKYHFGFHNDKSVRDIAFVYRFSFLVCCPLAIKAGLTNSRLHTLMTLDINIKWIAY